MLRLPDLADNNRLGRSIFSRRLSRRAENSNQIPRDVFLENEKAESISVDRMDSAPLMEMALLAENRAKNRSPSKKFYGWAIITVVCASKNGRTVKATPNSDNIYHADIFLNISKSVVGKDRRDKQKQHAVQLAACSKWQAASTAR